MLYSPRHCHDLIVRPASWGVRLLGRFILFLVLLIVAAGQVAGQELELANVVLQEPAGLPRSNEYVELALPAGSGAAADSARMIYAIEESTAQVIPCQAFDRRIGADGKRAGVSIIFPISLQANERKSLKIMTGRATRSAERRVTDLRSQGNALELRVENDFYQADLTSNTQTEGKKHHSGQLRELFLKLGFAQRLSRQENRMHWAPNFQKRGLQEYKTIAHWDTPKLCTLEKGPYLIQTAREDFAPGHPEILLSATYSFYAGMPFFTFVSTMSVVQDLWLELLRNDEMTMDSLFTHVAFQRPDGEVVDLAFSTRYEVLDRRPIDDDAPWLCFYHHAKGYAFGSIRLRYDNTNDAGAASPLFHPHTKISDGAGGGKYWNRRLVDERATFIPKGSRYAEENAYLVFRIEASDRFATIKYWSDRLRHPIRVNVIAGER